MFTGLVQAMGRVVAVRATRRGTRLAIRGAREWAYRPARGDSVSVSGCCLTVVGGEDGVMEFDVVPETLRKTTLGRQRIGTLVNLEHAATLATFLGGHLVQGHVDGVAEVARVQRPSARQKEWRVRVALPSPQFMQYIMPKGSICVDGVSLTVAAVAEDEPWFEVALIPETLARTTLKSLRAGHAVNIEVDAIAKTVVTWLRRYGARR